MKPKPFSISLQEARHMMLEDSLEQWATDQFAAQGIHKHCYLIMVHDKENNSITFIPVETTFWWRLKTKVLDFFGIKWAVRLADK